MSHSVFPKSVATKKRAAIGSLGMKRTYRATLTTARGSYVVAGPKKPMQQTAGRARKK